MYNYKVEPINKCCMNLKREKGKYMSLPLKRNKDGKTFKEVLKELKNEKINMSNL